VKKNSCEKKEGITFSTEKGSKQQQKQRATDRKGRKETGQDKRTKKRRTDGGTREKSD